MFLDIEEKIRILRAKCIVDAPSSIETREVTISIQVAKAGEVGMLRRKTPARSTKHAVYQWANRLYRLH